MYHQVHGESPAGEGAGGGEGAPEVGKRGLVTGEGKERGCARRGHPLGGARVS